MTHQRALINQWSPDPGRSLEEMKKVCADFRRFFPREPRLHVASAYCDVYSGGKRCTKTRSFAPAGQTSDCRA